RDVEEYEAAIVQLVLAMAGIDRPRHVLLIDIRQAPFRNDPEFEKRNMQFRDRVLWGFAKVAVVVSSQVGKLQIDRHAREAGSGPQVFMDEAGALRWLGVEAHA